MKLCKDCKWYDGELWCSSPNNGTCKVSGEITLRNAYIHRLNLPRNCGDEGKFFERKEDKAKGYFSRLPPFWK